MRTTSLWTDKLVDKNQQRQPVQSVACHPAGQILIACCAQNLLIYDVASGDLKQTLKAHKDQVFSVGFSQCGRWMVSGGADKLVIIWQQPSTASSLTSVNASLKWEGLLKYSHADAVSCVQFNPVTSQVASCSNSDFGLWSMEQKSVSKYRASAKIMCCAWSNDGQLLALGLANGIVSLRDRQGAEVSQVERSYLEPAPVWALQWSPLTQKQSSVLKSSMHLNLDTTVIEQHRDVLAVADWNQKLAFYQRDSSSQSLTQLGKERDLGYDPCTLQYVCSGNFLAIGGSDKKLTLYTRDGVPLGPICERDSWIWSCSGKPRSNHIVVGSHDGTVTMVQISFNTVHGLYQDRYAFRENMTDMTIQHLSNLSRTTISCNDYVKKIAIYRDRLAVQLSDRIIIYESCTDDPDAVNYRELHTVKKKLDCNLLVITSSHFVLCLEKRLQMFTFEGELEREWQLDAMIRYIKVIGGARSKEGLLVGLKNGQVLSVFLGNPFPVPMVKIESAVRCLDLNRNRTKIAVVDEHLNCMVYDVRTKALLYQEHGATSVAWNTDNDDMLCFSGNGHLYIKAADFPCYKQKMAGFVVGFKGSQIFCLSSQSMITIDVPQSTAMERYLDNRDFRKAFEVACLGVTDSAWRRLAMESLEALDFEIAKKAFVRLEDVPYLRLLHEFDKMKAAGTFNNDLALAEIYAYQGRFHDAAKMFKRAGRADRAVEMYTDLNMWEYAKKMAEETGPVNVQEILVKQAQVQEDKNDLSAAAKTYLEAGEYMKAVNIYGQNKWFDKLRELAKSMNKMEIKALNKCADFFRKNKLLDDAIDVYQKLGDIKSLVGLLVELQKWDDAFKIADLYPALKEQIYLPYANWLALHDNFVESLQNFRKADHMDQALKLMTKLVSNTVNQHGYSDASYYYWHLSTEYLKMVPDERPANELSPSELDALNKFMQFQGYAQLYHAYHPVHRFIEEPFSAHQPEAIFHMAKYLLHQYIIRSRRLPPGISMSYVYYALLKLSKSLGAFKFGRFVTDELLSRFRIPSNWRDTVETNALHIRGQPHVDSEELLSVCWNCGSVNPLLNLNVETRANIECTQCNSPFIFSSYNYEILGLVEFKPAPGITDKEAIQCIQTGNVSAVNSRKGSANDVEELAKEAANVLVIHDDSLDVERVERSTSILTRDELSKLSTSEVFMVDWCKPSIPVRFYRMAAPGLAITMCKSCFKFFHSDDYEFLVLQNKSCPFCREPAQVHNK